MGQGGEFRSFRRVVLLFTPTDLPWALRTRWPSIHVQSLCKFLSHLLIDVANNPNQANGSGSEGLYFASTSEHEQKELLEAIASYVSLKPHNLSTEVDRFPSNRIGNFTSKTSSTRRTSKSSLRITSSPFSVDEEVLCSEETPPSNLLERGF